MSDSALTAVAPAGHYPFRVGTLKCASLVDGALPILAARLMAEVDQDEVFAFLRERAVDVSAGFTQLSCLLVHAHPAGGTVLVDGGVGAPLGGNGPAGVGRLRINLARAGVAVDEVETILISHLHPDHIGGFFDREDDPVFPSATFYVPEGEATFWGQEGPDLSGQLAPPPQQAGEIAAAKRFLALAGERTQLFTPGETLLDTVETVDLRGHSPGQAGFIFHSGDASLSYTADAVGDAVISIERPGWRFGFDMDSKTAIVTRRRLIADLVNDGQRFFSPHFPWPNLGRLGAVTGQPIWTPEPWNWADDAGPEPEAGGSERTA